VAGTRGIFAAPGGCCFKSQGPEDHSRVRPIFQIGDRQAALDRHGEKICQSSCSSSSGCCGRGICGSARKVTHVQIAHAKVLTVRSSTNSYGRGQLQSSLHRMACRMSVLRRLVVGPTIPVPGRGYWAKLPPRSQRRSVPCRHATSEPQNRIQIKKRLIRQPGRSLVESDVQVTACP